MEKLLVIDGNSIINRAYFGVRPLTTREGLHTNAIYGMLNIIEKHLGALNPEYAAVAFDLKAPTFRHKMYADYKAGRRPTPPELLEQFAPAKEVLRAMGFTVVEKEGFEADDLIGTLANAAAEAGKEAYILTGDRDALQLIRDNITVLLATNTETIHFDRAAFVEHYGVSPEQFVDVKAIMGDKSDNIPGVAGIGEKGALKLIADFGSAGHDRQGERKAEGKTAALQGRRISLAVARAYRHPRALRRDARGHAPRRAGQGCAVRLIYETRIQCVLEAHGADRRGQAEKRRHCGGCRARTRGAL